MVVRGNQWVSQHVCSLSTPEKVDECHAVSQTAVSHDVFSPDDRYAVIWGEEVQDASFRILSVPGLEVCAGVEDPRERVITAAFSPDGARLAAVSKDSEVWMYGLGPDCRVTLQWKVVHPQLAAWPEIEMSFTGAAGLLLSRRSGELLAIDPAAGGVKWSRPGLGFRDNSRLKAQASPAGSVLAVWGPKEIALVDALSGTLLSGVMSVPGGVAHAVWNGESVMAHSAGDEKTAPAVRRRLTPAEAEARFLKGAPTSELMHLTPKSN
jgi:hypothetical protein